MILRPEQMRGTGVGISDRDRDRGAARSDFMGEQHGGDEPASAAFGTGKTMGGIERLEWVRI